MRLHCRQYPNHYVELICCHISFLFISTYLITITQSSKYHPGSHYLVEYIWKYIVTSAHSLSNGSRPAARTEVHIYVFIYWTPCDPFVMADSWAAWVSCRIWSTWQMIDLDLSVVEVFWAFVGVNYNAIFYIAKKMFLRIYLTFCKSCRIYGIKENNVFDSIRCRSTCIHLLNCSFYTIRCVHIILTNIWSAYHWEFAVHSW